MGFGQTQSEAAKEKAVKALGDFLRPEFIGRVDEIVFFRPLSKEDYVEIARLMRHELVEPLASRGITRSIRTKSNGEGMQRLLEEMNQDFHGLCFLNLVEFDSQYGHRNDVDGYAAALSEFDGALPLMLEKLTEEDLFIITADHGCDPATPSTDHSREYAPLLVYQKGKIGRDLSIRESFCDVAKSCVEFLGVSMASSATSFLEEEK